MPNFLVGLGGIIFPVEADDPRQAIQLIKLRIMLRAQEEENPKVSMTLVNAHRQGTLNYIVFDAHRTTMLAGEHHGQFQQPVTRELADSMRGIIPDNVYYSADFARTSPTLASLGFGPGEARALIDSLNRRLLS